MAKLTSDITASIDAFATDLANRYGLDKSELLDLWEKSSGVAASTIDVQNVVIRPKTKTVKTSLTTLPLSDPEPAQEATAPPSPCSISSGVSASTECDGCPYILTKGERQGQPCGKKPRKGATYCCRHKKYEGTEPKEKKVLPTVKKSVGGAAKPSAHPAGSSAGVKIVFREHKGCNHHCNPETNMALESIESKIVCGRCEKGVIVPLTSDDIEICKAHGFRYHDEPSSVSHTPDPMSPSPEPPTVPKKASHIPPRDGGSTKRSIVNAIATVALETEDVEQILGVLQLGTNSDGEPEDVLSEEEDDDLE